MSGDHLTLLAALETAGRVLLTGPDNPDGDSLGACLALQRILRARGVTAEITGCPSYRYTWMSQIEGLLDDAELDASWPAVVVLDGDRHRLCPGAERAFAAAAIKGIVDHHASTIDDGYTHFWLDAEVGSTCEMLYRALPDWGVELDQALAEALYTGLIFDTGAFRYSNTTPESHEMAAALLRAGIDHSSICHEVLMDRKASGLRIASHVYGSAELLLGGRLALGVVTLEDQARLGVEDGDLEGIVESLVQVKGVEVSVLVIERTPVTSKLSLRSRGRVNVAEVARGLATTGGGHAKAAGVSLTAPTSAICEAVRTQVAGALEDPSGVSPQSRTDVR